ncbi:MAG: nitronate monooxygenase, partial [Candidatus Eremiobacteraeota bacterium]|nr:nitronate monooxygenase [Candidatus Eremiobacteraeota bacterium]
FLLASEAANSAAARAQIAAADERSTILTHVFDVATRAAWPDEFRGRALFNPFAREWDGREPELAREEGAMRAFAEARKREDYEIAHVYAGQSVGLLERTRPAAEIVAQIVAEARACLMRTGEIVAAI